MIKPCNRANVYSRISAQSMSEFSGSCKPTILISLRRGLEKQLFNKDFTPTVGDSLRNLTDIKVTQEGESQVRPIKNVSILMHPCMFTLTIVISSKKLGSILRW